MWIVNSKNSDAGAVRLVDEHFVVNLGHWNFPLRSVNVKMNVVRLPKRVVKTENAKSSGVNVKHKVSIGCELSRTVFDRFPEKGEFFK